MKGWGGRLNEASDRAFRRLVDRGERTLRPTGENGSNPFRCAKSKKPTISCLSLALGCPLADTTLYLLGGSTQDILGLAL
jgi:hypothetical protein